MYNTNIISEKYIQENSPLTLNTDLKLYVRNVNDIQEYYLKPLMGDERYEAFMNAIVDNVENNTPLPDNISKVYPYAAKYVLFEALKQFLVFNQYKITNKGVNTSTDPNAFTISGKDFESMKNYIDVQTDVSKNALYKILGIDKVSYNGGGGIYIPSSNKSKGCSFNTKSAPLQVQSDWNETSPTSVSYIKNKPDLSIYITEEELDQTLENYYDKQEIDDIIESIEVDLTDYYNKTEVDGLLNNKVDKEIGKGLSQNDFTDQDKDKLDNLHNYDDTLIKNQINDLEDDLNDLSNNLNINYYNKTDTDGLLALKVDVLTFNALSLRVDNNETAIENLEQEIIDLPKIPSGGLINQILRKTSNNDYEVDWSNETTTFAPLNQILIGSGTGYTSLPNFTYNISNGFFTSQYVSWTNSGGVTSITTSGHMQLATGAVEIRFHNINFGTKYGQFHYGTSTPASSAIGDFFSTTRGFLIPRMTKTQRNAIASPADGLLVITTGEAGGSYISIYNTAMSRWEKVNTIGD